MAAVVRTVLGFGREAVVAVDAPSGRRLDLLAPGSPLREALGLPDGRYQRSRVCDALLYRRRLPLYPVPAAGQALEAWEEWMEVGFELFDALEPSASTARTPTRSRRPWALARCASAAVRDLSRRGVLLAARTPPIAQAHAVGPSAAHRRAADARRRRR